MVKSGRGYSEPEIREELAKGCDGTGNIALCAWYDYFKKDLTLNDTYRELMRRLVSADLKASLRKSQRAWLAYRESNCALASGGWEGGSFRSVVTAMCWESMTDRREQELAAHLNCTSEDCIELKESRPNWVTP